jgi:hypothetical protein
VDQALDGCNVGSGFFMVLFWQLGGLAALAQTVANDVTDRAFPCCFWYIIAVSQDVHVPGQLRCWCGHFVLLAAAMRRWCCLLAVLDFSRITPLLEQASARQVVVLFGCLWPSSCGS